MRDVERGVEICSAGESEQESSKTLIGALRYYEPMRSHLEAIALLQRERCGRAAQHESIAAGGYCSKEDSAQHNSGFLLAQTIRMVTATSARVSASPAVLARAREPAFATEFYRLFGLTRCLVEVRKRTALGFDYVLRAIMDR